MRGQRRRIWAAAAALFLARAGWGQDVRWQDVVRLETELGLAKSGAFYYLLHLESRTLELKSRGLNLRTWNIVGLDQAGRRPEESVDRITKKAAGFVPTRSKIDPVKESEDEEPSSQTAVSATGEHQLQSLEVHDMPDRFELILGSGLKIICAPPRAAVSSVLAKTARALWIPLKTLVLTIRKKSFSIIEIQLLEKKEAQTLYWTVSEGQKIFIVNN
ncbi:MAG: hypothetical protein JW736_07925 [Deltaproteobacteria bacterium]|nr:hypothetical protein [Deltaproteobacteria bacterium]